MLKTLSVHFVFWFFFFAINTLLQSTEAGHEVGTELRHNLLYTSSLHITFKTPSQSLALCPPLPLSPPPQASLTGQRGQAANIERTFETPNSVAALMHPGGWINYRMCACLLTPSVSFFSRKCMYFGGGRGIGGNKTFITLKSTKIASREKVKTNACFV